MGDAIEAPLGDLSQLPDGDMHVTEVDGIELLVCRVGGQLFAIEDVCSHADTPLSEGLLLGHKVVCPLHGAQFDVRDGTHSGPPAYTGVRCFAVAESPDGAVVHLTPPDKGPSTGGPGGYFQTR